MYYYVTGKPNQTNKITVLSVGLLTHILQPSENILLKASGEWQAISVICLLTQGQLLCIQAEAEVGVLNMSQKYVTFIMLLVLFSIWFDPYTR